MTMIEEPKPKKVVEAHLPDGTTTLVGVDIEVGRIHGMRIIQSEYDKKWGPSSRNCLQKQRIFMESLMLSKEQLEMDILVYERETRKTIRKSYKAKQKKRQRTGRNRK